MCQKLRYVILCGKTLLKLFSFHVTKKLTHKNFPRTCIILPHIQENIFFIKNEEKTTGFKNVNNDLADKNLARMRFVCNKHTLPNINYKRLHFEILIQLLLMKQGLLVQVTKRAEHSARVQHKNCSNLFINMKKLEHS